MKTGFESRKSYHEPTDAILVREHIFHRNARIADLAACGLVRPSFVPEQSIQELRSLLRARKQPIREQTSHIQRIQKTLEEANIKLDSVIGDIMGVSGRRMVEAMIAASEIRTS